MKVCRYLSAWCSETMSRSFRSWRSREAENQSDMERRMPFLGWPRETPYSRKMPCRSNWKPMAAMSP